MPSNPPDPPPLEYAADRSTEIDDDAAPLTIIALIPGFAVGIVLCCGLLFRLAVFADRQGIGLLAFAALACLIVTVAVVGVATLGKRDDNRRGSRRRRGIRFFIVGILFGIAFAVLALAACGALGVFVYELLRLKRR